MIFPSDSSESPSPLYPLHQLSTCIRNTTKAISTDLYISPEHHSLRLYRKTTPLGVSSATPGTTAPSSPIATPPRIGSSRFLRIASQSSPPYRAPMSPVRPSPPPESVELLLPLDSTPFLHLNDPDVFDYNSTRNESPIFPISTIVPKKLTVNKVNIANPVCRPL